MTYVRVALDMPVPALFLYQSRDATTRDLGQRALVPFGKKIAVGVIIEVGCASDLPAQRVRSILQILRDAPAIPPDVLALLKFCSDYYHHPIGQVVFTALPTRLRSRRPLSERSACRSYRLTSAGDSVDIETLPTRARMLRTLLAEFRARRGGLRADDPALSSPRARAVLRTMIEREWVEEGVARGVTRPQMIAPPGTAFALTVRQQEVAAAVLKNRGGFAPSLLFGVTGSGKTEIYLALIAEAIARGRQALLLVPEINLTPQLAGEVSARFPGVKLASLHSGLSESERLHNWLAAQSGEARIVLGTRLAVFTPMPDLALIIVDEENDSSYKQLDGLRYSARDIAVIRAKRRGLPVVLGSATPSLETYHKALAGAYQLHTLPERVKGALPAIDLIDTRGEPLVEGLSQRLLGAMHATIRRGEQCLVFINRRGYAPVIVCRACAWTAECHRCTAKLVLHADGRLNCHHCGHRERAPAACPQCGNPDLIPLGQGTQRVEAALQRIFGERRTLRIDSDSTRGKDAWQAMRRRIQAGEVDILVGTQILAKGHDFPQLNLVGVLNADGSLYSSSHRAGEQLFARLVQVAGRAGRGAEGGRVLVQTEFPHHPFFAALRRHDYPAFADSLLAERERAGLPPFSHQAVLRAEAARLELALRFLTDAVRAAQGISSGVTFYDPVPAALARRAGLDRAQVVIEARSRSALHSCLAQWSAQLPAIAGRRVRWALDVDPLEF